MIISDNEIEEVFAGTNFGCKNYREILNSSLLKKLCRYHCGHTITTIMQKLGLIGKTGKPTKKGIDQLREAYADIIKNSG